MDCPQITSATSDDITLSYDEKLELIEKEALSLYEYCLTKKFSKNQVRECIGPLTGQRKSVITRLVAGSATAVVYLSALVAIIAALWKWPTTNKILTANAKILSVKTLAIYDWRKFYDEDCLIENPYLPEKQTTKDDCMGCIEFRREGSIVERLKNINDTVLTDGFLYYDIPAIVSDPLKDWPRTEDGELKLSTDKIKELYLTEASLQSGFENCEFSTTLDQDNLTLHDFIRKLDKNDLPDKYHAAWENCEPKAAKVFRLYAKRPYFLPAMAEASKANQIIIAKGSFTEEDTFNIPQQQDSATWFIAIKGTVKVIISPIEECQKFKCRQAKFRLKEGEAAVIPTRIWTVEYTPLGPGSTLMFSSTVLWDDVM